METSDRMDGLTAATTRVAKGLLKLLGIIVEGKILPKHLTQFEDLLGKVTEKIKFFYYVSKKHPYLLKEYLSLFEVLWLESRLMQPVSKSLSDRIQRSLLDLYEEHKWVTMRLHTVGTFSDQNDLTMECFRGFGTLLVVEGYDYQWIDPKTFLKTGLDGLNFPKEAKIKHLIRFEHDPEKKVLDVTFICFK